VGDDDDDDDDDMMLTGYWSLKIDLNLGASNCRGSNFKLQTPPIPLLHDFLEGMKEKAENEIESVL
jgi:hypothetical protein